MDGFSYPTFKFDTRPPPPNAKTKTMQSTTAVGSSTAAAAFISVSSSGEEHRGVVIVIGSCSVDNFVFAAFVVPAAASPLEGRRRPAGHLNKSLPDAKLQRIPHQLRSLTITRELVVQYSMLWSCIYIQYSCFIHIQWITIAAIFCSKQQ